MLMDYNSAKRRGRYITYAAMRAADGSDAIAMPADANPRRGKGVLRLCYCRARFRGYGSCG